MAGQHGDARSARDDRPTRHTNRDHSAAPDLDRQLGARIRQLRRGQGITLKDAADVAGVSESFLSQVERGLANPSVDSLRRIAEALGQPMASMFEGPDSEGMVVRAADRRRMRHPSGEWEDSMLTASSARRLEIHETVIVPGGDSGEDLYTHFADEECVVVIDGEVEITVSGDVFRLSAGDALVLDPREGHRFRNPLKRPSTVLWVMTPPNRY